MTLSYHAQYSFSGIEWPVVYFVCVKEGVVFNGLIGQPAHGRILYRIVTDTVDVWRGGPANDTRYFIRLLTGRKEREERKGEEGS